MKIFASLLLLVTASCQTPNQIPTPMYAENTFGYDYEILKKDSTTVLLENGNQMVVLVGSYQARVMTSSSDGMNGFSYGWINHQQIQSGELTPHMNAFGGEERFWLGPEGGQFSVYFKPGETFTFENWQTPAIIDTETYPLVQKEKHHAQFLKEFNVRNYSGTDFEVSLDRKIQLLSQQQAEAFLGISLENVRWVGYQTENILTNIGSEDWNKDTGVLSIWLLGMMKASPKNTVIIPFQIGQEKFINDSYFGKISSDRLILKDGLLFFKADAEARGKIGIPPQALIPLAGSFDSENRVLTLIQFEYEGDRDYVNSMWEIQKEPYQGDALNAYNDGKNDLGKQMGKFYELESSSPAKALKRGESVKHVQRTYHLEGELEDLNLISKQVLGLDLNDLPWK
jgi:hypothetical protein